MLNEGPLTLPLRRTSLRVCSGLKRGQSLDLLIGSVPIYVTFVFWVTCNIVVYSSNFKILGFAGSTGFFLSHKSGMGETTIKISNDCPK